MVHKAAVYIHSQASTFRPEDREARLLGLVPPTFEPRPLLPLVPTATTTLLPALVLAARLVLDPQTLVLACFCPGCDVVVALLD